MNNIRLIFLIILTSIFETSFGQNSNCQLTKSASEKIFTVDKNDILCLAMNSEKEKTLVYTFGIWCAPCIKHLPNAIKLAREYNLDFYVLLMDKENSDKELNAIEFLKQIQEKIKFEIKVINLKDENGRPNKKYKHFLREITPPEFENINDMSKYIILDKLGNVLMVTNWKDNRENDWEDDSKMIEKRIKPILK
ncbi:TlpA family protein disulfide reductase [Winogradskyella sp. UBA3174]|uniref:TlpA family protein disulfide reductase n=1 Tax=Winogradskyella sp. UBA3174 TaxID=1947785 RepID=UPI0025DB05CB|nr:hypothetical protein [Winogradskyella sp. UBA3174]|tara:strand:- start:447 stop:1028 length:582 start_codon:yes stop_codon:yes gene_type:complete